VPAGTVDAYLASVPVGRMGTPEDVAHAVSFLASDGAGSSPASVSWSTEAAPSATDGGTRSGSSASAERAEPGPRADMSG